MNSECCCNETGIKSDVKSECDAVLRIVGMEDARARDVFMIRPFVGSIPYHGLCHASFRCRSAKQKFSQGGYG